jgi:signal transduction histidine kinase/CheY-like chemotaxis protein
MKNLLKLVGSIRSRIWIALALLAIATMLMGSLAWVSLDRANAELDNLHRQTLSEVAQALSISKKSADLATSAPFLLNLSSNYRIKEEGEALVKTLDKLNLDWSKGRQSTQDETLSDGIALSLTNMRTAIYNLIDASAALDTVLEAVIITNNKLTNHQGIFSQKMQKPDIIPKVRLNWLGLQSMANQALGAGFAGNLLGVGEYQRNFIAQRKVLLGAELNSEQQPRMEDIYQIASGPVGIFELRRKELSLNLEAQNALFHISYNAGLISDFAGNFAEKTETFLSTKRLATSTSISFAKSLILLFGLLSIAIALTSALYVSNYVTNNISRVANAMKLLAAGDRKLKLQNGIGRDDEIGDLFRSFRVFRANALRLDRSNNQLVRRNQLFEKVYNNISDGVVITDEQGNVQTANPTFMDLISPDIISKNKDIFELFKSTKFANVITASSINNDVKGFHEFEAPDGQILEIRITHLPDGGNVWLFTEATERKKIDARLNDIRRIESLAKMTGEVAHDFGNILTTISSNMYLMENSNSEAKTKSTYQRVTNAIEIGTSLTQRLLAFAKKQHLSPETVELNSLVEGLVDLIDIGLKDGVTVNVLYSTESLFVDVDPGQLESAILNLCLNSNQAINHAGKIGIHIYSTSPGVATVEVSDDGSGMDEDTKKHALEPFFTNRKDGEGTGLGLSMVYGFIKQTGGDIQIESTLQLGTSIKLSLPTTTKGEAVSGDQSKGTALLIEDDKDSLEKTMNDLKSNGLSVLALDNFQDGIEELNDNHQFDIVVTDLHLDSGHDGWKIVARALNSNEHSSVIVISGKLPLHHPFMVTHPTRVNCLSKPYEKKKFKELVQNIIMPTSLQYTLLTSKPEVHDLI